MSKRGIEAVALEAGHVLRGIAQKEADLMGEIPLRPEPKPKPVQHGLQVLPRPVAVLFQQRRRQRRPQGLLQLGRPVEEQQHLPPAAAHGPQGHPPPGEEPAVVLQPLLQVGELLPGEGHQVGRLQAGQSGGAVIGQDLVQGPFHRQVFSFPQWLAFANHCGKRDGAPPRSLLVSFC